MPEFSSLNLAQAVQVLCYELRMASFSAAPVANTTVPVAHDELEGFYEHLEQTLIAINFLDPKQPKMLMNRLRRLFNRAGLDKKEVNILRGILSALEK